MQNEMRGSDFHSGNQFWIRHECNIRRTAKGLVDGVAEFGPIGILKRICADQIKAVCVLRQCCALRLWQVCDTIEKQLEKCFLNDCRIKSFQQF